MAQLLHADNRQHGAHDVPCAAEGAQVARALLYGTVVASCQERMGFINNDVVQLIRHLEARRP